MGLFDKLFKATPNTVQYSPENEQEAMVAIMYGCMSVDGDVSDVEIDRLCQMVTFKTYFKGVSLVSYYKGAMLVHKKIGSQGLIDASVLKVKAENRATLFAMVMDLLLSDGVLEQKEQEIAEYLSEKLTLESPLATKIVEVILIRNKDNVVIV